MKTVFILALSGLLSCISHDAFARAPKTRNERSLLYWRYLCENQPQKEVPAQGANSKVELHCLSQGWMVKASGVEVQEVIENGH